jgi:hypothetical protein
MPISDLGGERGVWVNDVWGWTDPETGRNYALVARRDGASFVDVTNPAAPRLVGNLPRTDGSRPSVWRDIKVIGQYAYIVSDGAGAHGMQVFDLGRLRDVGSEPVDFEPDTTYREIFSAHNVVADTASKFLVHRRREQRGTDVRRRAAHRRRERSARAQLRGVLPRRLEPERPGLHARRSVPHLPGTRRGVPGPSDLCRVERIRDQHRRRDGQVESGHPRADELPERGLRAPGVVRRRAAVLLHERRDGRDVRNVEGTRTIVWDLTELDDPIVANEYIGPVMASDHNLYVKGDRMYQSNYGSGLRVLDITDRANPHEIAFFDSAPYNDDGPGAQRDPERGVEQLSVLRGRFRRSSPACAKGLFIMRVSPPPVS